MQMQQARIAGAHGNAFSLEGFDYKVAGNACKIGVKLKWTHMDGSSGLLTGLANGQKRKPRQVAAQKIGVLVPRVIVGGKFFQLCDSYRCRELRHAHVKTNDIDEVVGRPLIVGNHLAMVAVETHVAGNRSIFGNHHAAFAGSYVLGMI